MSYSGYGQPSTHYTGHSAYGNNDPMAVIRRFDVNGDGNITGLKKKENFFNLVFGLWHDHLSFHNLQFGFLDIGEIKSYSIWKIIY